MNKVYKVVWNASLGSWVAVSEMAKGNKKTKALKTAMLAVPLLMVSFSSNAATINTAGTCVTASTGQVGNINPGVTNSQATDGSGTYSLVAGCEAKGNNQNSATAYGSFSEVTGRGGTAVGHNSKADAFATSVGVESRATGVGSTAVGEGTQATGQNAVALGGTATGNAAGNVLSVADAVTASGSGAVAIGGNATRGAQATGTNSIALGGESRATNTGTIAIGNNANTGGNGTETLNNIAIGSNAKNGNVVSGNAAGTGGQIALGSGATTTTFAQVAIGVGADAGGNNYSIAIGGGAKVTANSGVAVGGVAMGRNTQAGSFATSIGPGAQATATNSSALGNGATSSANNATALGNGANASIADSVALGSGSTTTAPTGTGYITNSAAPTSVVSVGTASNLRRIQNVADGAADQDAVTVAQLKDVNNRAVGNTTALGGGAAYNAATDTYTAPSYTINKADTGSYAAVTNVGAALSNLNTEIQREITFVGNTGNVGRNLGETLNITGGLAGAGSNSNVKTVITGNTVDIQIANSPNFSGTVTSTGQQVNGNSTITGNSNVNGTSTIGSGANAVTLSGTANGLDVGGKKITNVADATAATDAVNKGQLDTVSTQANKAITFTGNARKSGDTKDVDRKLGEAIAISGAASTAGTYSGANVKTVTDQTGSIAIQIADAPNFAGTVTSTGQQVNGNSVVTGTSTIGSGANAVTLTGTVNGLDVGGKKITNVAAPTVGSDATNKTYVDGKVQTLADNPLGFVGDSGTKATRKLGEDLNVKGGATGTLTNGNIGVVSNGSNQLDIKLAETVNLGTNGSVTTGNSKIDNSGLTITGGPSVTSTGINAGSKVITNVAAGTVATDAVNKGQLDTVSTQANKAITFTGNARKSGDTTDVDRKLGESIAISGAASTAGTYSGANVKTVTDQTGSIAIQIADAPNFAGTVTSTGQQVNGNSVVTGTSTIGSGANAVTLTGTANGLDVGGKKITNVAAPTVGSDATNKTYVDGKVQTLADNPLGFVGDSGTKATRKLGEDLNVKGGATGTLTNGNIGVVSNGSNQLDIKLAETVNLGTNGSVTTGNSKIDNSGLTITGGPSVTTTGINAGSKVITNVAAGAAITDAVNKGQLDAATTASDTKTDNLGNSTATNLGGGSTYDSKTGNVSAPNYVTTKTDGSTTSASNVGDALTNLNNEVVKPITFAGNSGTVDRKLGETLNITGGLTGAGSNSNIKTVITGNTVDIQLADAPVFAGKVTANGLDANGNKVENVADATVASDAVNKGQLDAATTASDTKTDNLGNSTATNLGGGSTYDSKTGNVSAPNYVTTKTDGSTTSASNVGDALTNLNNEVVKPITFAGNSGTVDRKLGETLNITGGLTGAGSNSNIKTVITGNTVDIQLADAPVFAGKVTANGLDANGNKVENVADATVASDAVNKGQLDAATTASDTKTDNLGNSTATNLGGGSTYDSKTGNVSAPNYVTTKTDGSTTSASNVGDALTNLNNEVVKPITFAGNSGTVDRKLGETLNITGGLTGAGSNSNIKTVITGNTVDIQLADAPVFAGKVTANGLDANGNKVENVADATVASDAVNKGQLDAATTASDTKTDNLGNSTATNLGGGSTYDSKTGNVSAPNYVTTKTDGSTTSASNVGDALTNLNNEVVKPITFAGNSGTVDRKLGETLNITGGLTGAGSNSNIKTVITGNTVDIQLADAPVFAGKVTANGLDANGNKVENVADATVASDAVNKGQLDAATTASDTKTDNLGNSTATNLGGGSTYDSKTGNVSAPNYVTTKTDGSTTSASNVGDALTNLNNEVVKPITFAGNSGTVDRKLGETLNITGGLTGAGSNSNIKTVITGNTVDIQLADAPVFAGKVTANGLDANGNKVENVADATVASDAVNKGQLDAATTASDTKTDNLGNSTATNLGGGSTYDSKTGNVSAPNYVTTKTDGSTTSASNVGDALTNLNNEVVKPITFAGNSGTVDRKLGETLNITGGLTGAGSNSNIKTVITGNTVDIQLADAPVFAGKVTANGLDANGNKVENVADATVASDAVNKGQLDAATTASDTKTDNLGNSTATNLGGGSTYDSKTGNVSAPNYVTTKTDGSTTSASNVGDALTNLNNEVVKPITFAGNSGTVDRKLGETLNITGGLTGAGSNSNIKTVITGNTVDIQLADAPVFAGKVTANGLDANGNKVENVADATVASDAVNKGQLDAATTASDTKTDNLGNSTATNLGGGSTYDSKTGNVSAPNYVTTKTDGSTTSASNVGDALTNLNNEVVKPITFAGNSGTVDRKLGETLNITGGLTGAGSNSNIKTVITGNTVDIQLADAPVFAGKVTANGLDANGNKVENVADATVASDAVNKGQLDAATTASDTKTDNLGNSTATNLGGGSTYDSKTGNVSAPNYVTTKTDGSTTSASNVGDALTNLNNEVVKPITFAGNSGTVDRKLGETLNITGGLTGAGSNSNIKTVITGNTVDIQLADAPVFAGKVTANGLDANGNKVENVADATVASDAVNKGQLDAATTASDTKTDNLGNSTATNLGGGSTYDSKTGNVSAPNYVTTKTDGSTTSASNVGDALTNLNNEVVKPITFAGNSGTVDRKLGETLNITGGLTGAGSNSNIKTVITGNTVDIQLADAPVFAGKVTANGLDANGNKVENVADATVASDAVNKGQLDAATTASDTKTDNLGNSTATNLGGGSTYDSKTGNVSAPNYVTTKTDGSTTSASNVGDALTNLNNEVVKPITFAGNSGTVDRKLGETLNITGGLTGAGSNSNIKTVITGNTVDIQLADAPVFAGKVTANGLDANGNKVENVADATVASDAVNKGQLDAATTASDTKTDNLGNSTATNLGGGSTYDSKTGNVSAPNYVTTKTDGSTTSASNVGDALTNLNNEVVKPITFAGNSGTVDRKLGETLNITGGLTGAGSNSNIKTVITGNTVDIQLADAPVFAGKVTANGLDANGNKVENVADATVASDAVNKGQLDAATTASDTKTDNLGNSTATNLGGGSTYDSKTGNVSAPNYVTTKTDGSTTSASNVGDALTNLNNEVVKPITFAGNSGTVDRKLGETLNITGGLTGAGSNSNIKTVITGNTVDIQLADAPVFAGKVTANGLDANGNKVENVADATVASDAVNKGQLDAATTASDTKTDNLGNSTATNLGGGSTYDSKTGNVSAPNYVTTKTDGSTTSASNVGDALTNLNNEVVKPITFAGNSGTVDRKLGETLNITGGLTGAGSNSNIKTVITGNTVDIQLADAPVFAGKVTANGLDANGNKVENVADATVASDAVNKGQLDAATTASDTKTDNLGNSTATNLGGGSTYDSKTGNVSAPNYVTTKTDGSTTSASNVGDALTNLNNEVVKPITFAGNSGTVDRKLGETLNITGGLTGAGSNSNIKTVITGNTVDIQLADAPVFAGKVTANGLDANGNKVENVADATVASDAVNKGQLDAATTASDTKTDNLGNSTATNLGGGSTYDSKTGNVSAPNYVTTKTDGSTTSASNVGDALTNLNNEVVKPITFAGNSGTVDRKLGETLNITGGLTGAGSNSNIKTVITGNTVDIQLADAPVFAGKVTANGLDANGNKVENVADATVASDAVNKGQLDAATTASDTKTDNLGNSTATNLGGGSTYDSKTGNVSAPNYVTTKTDGSTTSASNVGDALTNLNNEVVKPITFAGNSGTVDRKLGETLNITGGLTGAGSNSNIKTVITGNTVDIQLADAPVFAGKVTANGLDANGNKVENVADATVASDAVNKGQLDAATTASDTKTDNLGNSTATNLGGGSTYDSKTGNVSAPNYVTTKTDGSTTSASNVGDALTNLNNEVVKPITFAGNSGTVDRKLGETLNITGGLTGAGSNSNIKTVITGNTVDIQLADAPVFAGKVTANGLDANGNKVENVADATVASDAVNKGQLDAATTASDTKTDNLGNSTATNLGGGSTYDSKTGNVSAPNYVTTKTDGSTTSASNVGDALTNLNNEVVKPITFAGNSGTVDRKLGETLNITGGLTGAGSNSNIKTVITGNTVDIQLADAPVFAGKVTANGLDANGNKVENVADATVASDAVNKGQLDATQATVDKGIKFGNGTSNNQFALGDTINVKGSTDGSITSTTTADGVQLGLGNTIKVGTANPVTIDGTAGTIGGLSNTTWNGTAVSGQAATEDQLAAVDGKLGNLDDAAVKYDDPASKDKVTLAGAGGTTITNVKAGAVNSTSTDAINGSQLHGVADSVKTAIGGATTIDATTGAITTSNIGGTGSNTIDGAISNVKATTDKGINFGGTTGKNNYALGSDINVKGDSNITSTTIAGGVQLGLGDTLNVKDAINVGSGATKVKIDGTTNTIGGLSNTTWNGTAVSGQAATEDQLAAVDGKLVNLDDAAVKYDDPASKDKVTLAGAGGTTITNVKAGVVNSTSTDAINGSQLHGVADSVKTAIGGNTTIDATTGAITTSNIGGTGSNTIDGAITSVKDAATKAKTTVTAGDNVVVTPTTNADGSSNYQVATAKDVNFDKVTVGSVVVDKTTNTIKGLSNTTWNGTAVSGQAATEDQLAAVDSKLGGLDDAAVKYDNATTKDKITLAGAGGTTITNVKAGAVNSTSTDAINGSQLHGVADSIKNAIGGSTTIDATTGAITTSNIGGTGSNTIDGAITSVKDAATKAKTTVTAGDNVVVTPTTNADGSSNYQVATAKDVNFDKVTVGSVVVDKASNTIEGLSNKDITAGDFATKGRAATEEQLKVAISNNITEVVDGNGNKVNIIDQVVNKNPDNKNQDSLFLTYDKQGQETTDRLTIGQTVQKMNTDGIKFFHTNADTSKGDLGATNDSSAGGINSTAIGVNAIVSTGADSAVALGHNSKAGGKESIAIGQGAEASGLQSISIGTGNKVKGDHSGAIGDPTIVDGANSYSVGNNNQVLTDDTFVLGNNVTKTVAGSVVLGNGSAATTGAGVAGYALSAITSTDKTAIDKTTSTTGAVAVGDAASGIYRQITGVAAGSADADAVNVAQLKAVGNQVVTTQTKLVNSLGGGAKVNTDGTITGPNYNVAQGNQTNVGDALTALDKAIGTVGTTSKTTVTNGQNIVVNKSKNADGSDNYEVATAKDLTVDSVKAGNTVLNNAGINIGNNAVVLSNTGLTIKDGPSVTTQGINAGNKQVTNVAAGVNATDAVNKGQLDSAISNVNNNVNELANNAVKYDDAKKDKITLGGGADGTTITNVKDGTVAQGSKDAVNGGQVAQIRDNLQGQITNNTNDINNIKNDINNGAVGLVKQANSSAEVTVAKDTGGTSVNVAGKDGDRVVTGVKDGAISATSKDAINGSQLNATNKKVVEFLGGGAGYDNITNSFTNPTYNVGGKDYNNVGGAVDALNKADQALNSKIDNVSNRLEQAFYSTNQRIDDVEKKANAGIAAAMALEAAPYIAGKYTYSAGASYHGGENAVGVTLRKTADNGRWSITGGVAAASQGDPSVRIGISGVID